MEEKKDNNIFLNESNNDNNNNNNINNENEEEKILNKAIKYNVTLVIGNINFHNIIKKLICLVKIYII